MWSGREEERGDTGGNLPELVLEEREFQCSEECSGCGSELAVN